MITHRTGWKFFIALALALFFAGCGGPAKYNPENAEIIASTVFNMDTVWADPHNGQMFASTMVRLYTPNGFLYTSDEIAKAIQYFGSSASMVTTKIDKWTFVHQLIISGQAESESKFPQEPQDMPWPME